MGTKQRYISNELTHFVGRALKQEEQFELLIKIIESGMLLPRADYTPPNGHISMPIFPGRISDNKMYLPNIVCFCDIPFSDLNIHIQKYGNFGIAFNREFLVAKGATPVFYISKDSKVDLLGMNVKDDKEGGNLSTIWDNVISIFSESSACLMVAGANVKESESGNQNKENEMSFYKFKGDKTNKTIRFEDFEIVGSKLTLREEILMRMFLTLHNFNFLKFFDSTKADDDPENYYMEREWRVLGHVEFLVHDISSIIMPRKYGTEFRKRIDNYDGQLIYID